jgi:hypothetical protein
LFEAYKKKAALLVSDGVVEDGGTIKVTTRTGATLTSANTLRALKLRQAKKNEDEAAKVAAEPKREATKVDREKHVAEVATRKRRREEKKEAGAEAELQKLRAVRQASRSRLDFTRTERRRRRRETATSRNSQMF